MSVNPLIMKGFTYCYHLGESTFILGASFFEDITQSKQKALHGALCSAALYLGLYSMPMSHKKEDKLK